MKNRKCILNMILVAVFINVLWSPKLVNAQVIESEHIIVVDMKTGSRQRFDLPKEENINRSIIVNGELPSYNYYSLKNIMSDVTNVLGFSTKINPLAIFGPDDRQKVENTSLFPYCAVARLNVTYADGTENYSTGAMINNHLLMTAGHVLMHGEFPIVNVKVQFGRKGSYTYYEVDDFSHYIVKESYADFNGKVEDDYGFLVFSSNVGQYTGHFGYIYNPQNSETLYTAGYPDDKSKGQYMYAASGNILSLSKDVLTFDVDTYGGQSGSPLYVMRDGQPYAIGAVSAHNDSFNLGRRLDTELYQWLVDHGYWR